MSSRSVAAPQSVAVEMDDVSKVYRLYQKPAYRFLDLLGLCPNEAGLYTEHAALRNVSLTVSRGEKVAVIGRNGAGKSTLLKIICGLVRPSAGSVLVTGRVSNLLQIGSGFHPDFTGRQNVFASLAHQGITGRDADRLFDEIADFAEITEYIDQPMKTYSTGMCSRLMFSSSIVVKPDILIVDEILGVGDAYFSHKSFERMRELCSGHGTTLVLVTHDIYGAQNICDRFIWVDRGQVKFDGDGKTAVAMYETSVKEQEEAAHRRRAVSTLTPAESPSLVALFVAVRSPTGFALQRPLALGQIELIDRDGHVERLDIGDPANGTWQLLPESNLGPVETVGGRKSRALLPYGSIYHKAEWIVTLPETMEIVRARVQWMYSGTDKGEFVISGPRREVMLKGELGRGPGWQDATFHAAARATEPAEPVQTEFGSGVVRITNTQLLDTDGREVTAVRHGDPLVIRLTLAVNRADVEELSVVLGFTRHGTSYAVNIVDHYLRLPGSEYPVVDVTLPAVRLGSGTWFLRVGVAEAGLFKGKSIDYFAIDGRWYHLMREGVQFEVTSVDLLDSAGCFMIHDGHFTVNAPKHASPAGQPRASVSR